MNLAGPERLARQDGREARRATAPIAGLPKDLFMTHTTFISNNLWLINYLNKNNYLLDGSGACA